MLFDKNMSNVGIIGEIWAESPQLPTPLSLLAISTICNVLPELLPGPQTGTIISAARFDPGKKLQSRLPRQETTITNFSAIPSLLLSIRAFRWN